MHTTKTLGLISAILSALVTHQPTLAEEVTYEQAQKQIGWEASSKENLDRVDRVVKPIIPLSDVIFSLSRFSDQMHDEKLKKRWPEFSKAERLYLEKTEVEAPLYYLGKADLSNNLMGFITASYIEGHPTWSVSIYLVDKKSNQVIDKRPLSRAWRESPSCLDEATLFTEPLISVFVDVNKDGKLDLLQRSGPASEATYYLYLMRNDAYPIGANSDYQPTELEAIFTSAQKSRKAFPN